MKCGRGVAQGSLWVFESRWLAVAASERKRGMFLATRPSKTRCFLEGNKHFCKIASLHPKMVGIVSCGLFWTSWGHSEGARGSGSTHLVGTWGHLGTVGPLIWSPLFGWPGGRGDMSQRMTESAQ